MTQETQRSALAVVVNAIANLSITQNWGALGMPLEAQTFTDQLQQEMHNALSVLDKNLPNNNKVKIKERNRGWISITPLKAQPEPRNLTHLKAEITHLWPMTGLLDILKETDLRVNFTQYFTGIGTREVLSRETLQKRLLLCLYGLGTNMGLKRVSNMTKDVEQGEQYTDLQYVYQRYLHKDALRQAIAAIVNETFRIRHSYIWGEGTTACASDARKFAAWDGNLLTEWHVRYHGRGVMVYWHVERNSACIYSQLKSCSSSEVAAMIEGVLRQKVKAKPTLFAQTWKSRKITSIPAGRAKSASLFVICLAFSCYRV